MSKVFCILLCAILAGCGGGSASDEVCGDGVCRGSENPDQCPDDCNATTAYCGDGVCTEDPATCPDDCTGCGDGTCSAGESSQNCADDCGSCGERCSTDGTAAHYCGADGSDRSVSCPTSLGSSCQEFSDGDWCDCGTITDLGACFSDPTAGVDLVACFDGYLDFYSCSPGTACTVVDNYASCRCDNLDDNICPNEFCTDDPDCVTCVPNCGAKTCGSNGCGGTCGECALFEHCEEWDGQCHLDSFNSEELAPGYRATQVAVDSNYIYFNPNFRVARCPLDGCADAPQVFSNAVLDSNTLLVFGNTVFWVKDYNGRALDTATGRVNELFDPRFSYQGGDMVKGEQHGFAVQAEVGEEAQVIQFDFPFAYTALFTVPQGDDQLATNGRYVAAGQARAGAAITVYDTTTQTSAVAGTGKTTNLVITDSVVAWLEDGVGSNAPTELVICPLSAGASCDRTNHLAFSPVVGWGLATDGVDVYFSTILDGNAVLVRCPAAATGTCTPTVIAQDYSCWLQVRELVIQGSFAYGIGQNSTLCRAQLY
jgi:hypothetical protein